jgi:hypothetical protein
MVKDVRENYFGLKLFKGQYKKGDKQTIAVFKYTLNITQ